MAKKLLKRRLKYSQRHFAPFKDVISQYLFGGFSGAIHLDLTYGDGSFCELIQKRFPNDKIIAFDVDDATIETDYTNMLSQSNSFKLITTNFLAIDDYLWPQYAKQACSIIIDLGYSQRQLHDPKLGLSYQRDGLLDMNYVHSKRENAAQIINTWTKQSLVELFFKYGEERYARTIANAILNARKAFVFTTTFELVKIIQHAVPNSYRRLKHPARKTFQALRVYINDELSNLRKILQLTLKYLINGGRLFIITFNSLEDRIVKNFMRSLTTQKQGHKYLSEDSGDRKQEYELIQRKAFKYEVDVDSDVLNVFKCAKLRILVRKE